jgi:hypothetical protein
MFEVWAIDGPDAGIAGQALGPGNDEVTRFRQQFRRI